MIVEDPTQQKSSATPLSTTPRAFIYVLLDLLYILHLPDADVAITSAGNEVLILIPQPAYRLPVLAY